MSNEDKKKQNRKVNYSKKAEELKKLDKKNSADLASHIRKRDALLTTMIDKQYDMLLEFSKNATEDRKKEIQKEMLDRQQKMEEMLKEVQNTYEKYEHVANKSTKKAFEAIQKTSVNGVNVLWKEMDKRFKGLSDLADDLSDDIAESFTQKFSEAAREIREFAMQLNIDSIASSLSDSVDNYVETMRDIRRRTGDNFNEEGFQRTVSDIVDSTATYSRAEAASLVKDVIGASSVKDSKYYRPYLEEIANTTKAMGASFEDMQDIMFIDMAVTGPKDKGSFMRSIDNVAFSLAMNHELNVNEHELLRSINENIHDIYGLSKGDSKRQIGMVKSLSAIESIQQTVYSKGASHAGEQLQEWMKKSMYELYEDDNFVQFMNFTGTTMDEFLAAREDPEKMANIYLGYSKSAAEAMENGDAYAHTMAQALGFTDSQLMEFGKNSKEISEIAKNTIESLKKETKGSLAAHQAGKGSGIVEKFWNKVSDNFVVRGISDIFANFDMKLANMANAAIVASKGAELWQSFKQFRVDNKTFFDTFKKDGFFKAIKGTEKYQQAMADGMVDTVKNNKFIKKYFSGDFFSYVTRPLGKFFTGKFTKIFSLETYKSLYKSVKTGLFKVWGYFIVKNPVGKFLFGKSEGIVRNMLKKLGNVIKGLFPGYNDLISIGKAFDKPVEALGKSSGFLKTMAEGGGKFAGVASKVVWFFDKIDGFVGNFFSKLAGASKFLKGLPLVSMFIDSVFGLFKTTDWFGEGASIGQYIITGLTSAIAGSGGGLFSDDSWFSNILDIGGNAFKGAAAGAVFGPHGAIAGAIIGVITAAIGGERIAKAVDWLKDNILELPFKFFDGVSSVFGYLKETTTGWIDTIANFLAHPFDSLFGKKESKTEEVVGTLKSDVRNVENENLAKSLKNDLGWKDDEIKEYLQTIAKTSSEQLKEEKDTTKFAFDNFKKTGLFAKNKKDSIFEKLKKSLFGDKETGSTGLLGSIKNSVSSVGSSVGSRLGSIVGSNPAKASTSSNENQRKIWNFFKEKGMSEAGIAGLMGNLRAESNLESNIVEGGSHANEITLNGNTGYGLAQWTSLNRQQGLYDYAKSKGTSTSDLNTQLEYLWQELNGSYKSVLSRLMNATSVQEASNAVLHDFESPFDQSKAVEDLRASYGLEIQKENASLANSVIEGNTGITNMPGTSNSFVDKQTELDSLKVNTVPVSTIPNVSDVSDDVSKVSNDIVYGNPSPVPESNSKDVVDTMKWQVYRLESKLDKLIMVMAGQQNNRRSNILPNTPSETDLAFSSL